MTADDFKTAEYLLSWALDAVDAAAAYARGYTGLGVLIGIVDFGFDFDSAEVNYTGTSVGRDPQAVAWYEDQWGPVDEDLHGHAVAATAAGVKNEDGIHGLAFNAMVIAADFFSGVNETTTVAGGVTYHISDPWTYLTSLGARIINQSFGYDGGGVAIPPGLTDIYGIAESVTAVANGALLVAAAGNSGASNPDLSNRDIVRDINSMGLTGGPGAFIIAGAVKQSGGGYVIADFSSRAGNYKDDFMVAPGEDVVFPWNGELDVGSGTSFSTPLIVGAAALIMERWPNLTAIEVKDILFASAIDLGNPGVDRTYGHGLLNIDAALAPIGVATLAVAEGEAPPVSATALTLGAPFGDAANSLRAVLASVTMLDAFGRDFGIDLSGAVAPGLHSGTGGFLRQRLGWHGAAYNLGTSAAFNVRIYDDPANAFRAADSLVTEPTYSGVVQFAGTGGPVTWTAGWGLGLGYAIAPETARLPAASPLTWAFLPVLGTDPGIFAVGRTMLDGDTMFSFGISQADGSGFYDRRMQSLRSGGAVQTAAFRLDYLGPAYTLSAELGGLVEHDAVLGSRGIGGLRLTDRSTTLWTSFSGQTPLAAGWTLNGKLALAATGPGQVGGSLIAGFGPILSSGLSVGVARHDLLTPGDALSFTVNQPLRVENAPLTMIAGTGRNPANAVFMEHKTLSLVPSGREIALETGYRSRLGAWTLEANVAYRLDADHVAGRKDTAAMLWFTRLH